MEQIRHNFFSLFRSKYFLTTFLMLMGIMTAFFLFFSLYSYRNTKNILQQEALSAGEYNIELARQNVENYLEDMRYIAATLDTSQMVQIFFSSENPQDLITNIHGSLQETLKTYVNGFPSIDSIYLYSGRTGDIITSSTQESIRYFSDLNWMDHFSENPDKYTIFMRSKNDIFPYLLCIMKQLRTGGTDSAIVINIDLSRLASLNELEDNPYQKIYMVSDDGQIMYRSGQRELFEPLETVPELENFNPEIREGSSLCGTDRNPYTFTQIKSETYPWHYICVTYLTEYSGQLSSSRAIFIALVFALFAAALLIALFFSLHSFRPIQNIIEFLNDPALSGQNHYSTQELKYIADKITSYIQTNQDLSRELEERLNTLNQTRILALQSQINPHFLFNTLNMIHILECEELGYTHPLPKMTLGLSKLARYAIESTDLVTLKTELEYTEIYLSILKQRYGGLLKTVTDVDFEAYRCKVPKLFIQPLIENAVFHGLSKKVDENSCLTITCRLQENRCCVSVKDNGVGMHPDTLKKLRQIMDEPTPPHGSIGLKNVVTRMQLLYGNDFSLEIESREGDGSVFILRFPILR